MSLEQAIEKQTEAINEQSKKLLLLIDILGKMIKNSEAEKVIAEDAPSEKPEAKKEKEKPKTVKAEAKSKPEPEPEPEEEPEAFSLPPGKRDKAYYDKYVYPHTAKLQELDKALLIKLVQGTFKSPRGGREVAPELWDEMVAQAILLIPLHERQGAEESAAQPSRCTQLSIETTHQEDVLVPDSDNPDLGNPDLASTREGHRRELYPGNIDRVFLGGELGDPQRILPFYGALGSRPAHAAALTKELQQVRVGLLTRLDPLRRVHHPCQVVEVRWLEHGFRALGRVAEIEVSHPGGVRRQQEIDL